MAAAAYLGGPVTGGWSKLGSYSILSTHGTAVAADWLMLLHLVTPMTFR
jgi:hypothetical protein